MSNCDQPSDTEAVASRNRFRKQFGLPPVELHQELERIDEVQQQRAFERWMQSALRRRVEKKLLQRLRRRLGKPDWQPTGVLSGGGWAFHVALKKQIKKLRARLTGG